MSLNLKVLLLNTRSLKTFAVDISKESRLWKSDILCLMETCICLNDDNTEVKNIQFQYSF